MAKIYLVDDDLDLLEQNKMVLNAKGHEILTASSADEARSLLKKQGTPDLMVVDVMMENHTAGLSLCRDLGKSNPNLPLIILSGDPNKPNWMGEDSTTWNSVTRFLDKPVTPEKLCAAVDEVLK